MLILSFLGPCLSKLDADLVVVSNSNHSNITFYRDPGRHPNLHCLTQSPQCLCEVEDIITVIFQRRKPESTEVQSRAGIWTRSSDFKLERLWFEHHHCEYLTFDWKNTNIGACSTGGVLWEGPPSTLHCPTCFLFLVLPSFLFLTWAYVLSRWTVPFHSFPLLSLVCTDHMSQGFF